MTIIYAILIFCLLIFVHEFGHFIIAKANGITVVEFSIGFGPKLIHFRKGETEYCIKALPFGGACTMLGDEFLEMSVIQSEEDNDEELTDEEKEAKKRNITQKNMQSLKETGVLFVEPTCGLLACGDIGRGKLADQEDIMEMIHYALSKKTLTGKKILVSAGPSRVTQRVLSVLG